MTERFLVANKGQNHYDDIFIGCGTQYKEFKNYTDAEEHAKKLTSKRQEDTIIFKSFATAKAIVPEIEVVKH